MLTLASAIAHFVGALILSAFIVTTVGHLADLVRRAAADVHRLQDDERLDTKRSNTR